MDCPPNADSLKPQDSSDLGDGNACGKSNEVDVLDDGLPPSKRTRTVPSSNGDRTLLHSCIVKLIVQSVCPDYAEPWRRKTQESWTGTGFLISERRIVTNAHVVERCTHVRARKSSSPVMFSCTVEWLSVPLDLALLTVNDESAFFQSGANAKSVSPRFLSLCPILPRLDENVTCVGFPQGGSQISVTRGVVSRVDVGSNGVLRIQIDAAINPGNSGGPVFDESGRVVGVAMSHLKGGSNIGYIIPVEVLSNFLAMCDDNFEASAIERSSLNASPDATESVVNIEAPKMVPGIVAVDAYTQTMESKALRNRLGLDDNGHAGGVRVAGLWLPTPRYPSLDSGEEENECGLQVDDVLVTIDGIEVGQDGTVPLSASRPDERISKSHLFTRHRVGHKIKLGILRSGKQITLNHKLVPLRYLCAVHDNYDAHPSYVVSGGCVFVPLSWPWISAHKHSDGWEGGFPSYNSVSSLPAQSDKQIIVLSRVLADEVNIGYHLKKWLILRSVNGKEPANMRELVRLISRAGNETHLEFRLHPINEEKHNEQVICLNMEECKEAEDRILKQHMIASWCSDDVIPAEIDAARAKTMVSTLSC